MDNADIAAKMTEALAKDKCLPLAPKLQQKIMTQIAQSLSLKTTSSHWPKETLTR